MKCWSSGDSKETGDDFEEAQSLMGLTSRQRAAIGASPAMNISLSVTIGLRYCWVCFGMGSERRLAVVDGGVFTEFLL